MGTLVQQCLSVTGRTYPSGYGFALTYLRDNLEPAHLRQGACLMVAKAYGPDGHSSDQKDSDLVRFVNAYATATTAEGYMIEAAQLCLAWALSGDADAANVMRLCGHPGY